MASTSLAEFLDIVGALGDVLKLPTRQAQILMEAGMVSAEAKSSLFLSASSNVIQPKSSTSTDGRLNARAQVFVAASSVGQKDAIQPYGLAHRCSTNGLTNVGRHWLTTNGFEGLSMPCSSKTVECS